jgi:hypothetical protein
VPALQVQKPQVQTPVPPKKIELKNPEIKNNAQYAGYGGSCL